MFNITIEQSVLAKALEFLEPTVGKNTNQLGDNCIAMATTGNSSMTMYTTNTIEYTHLEVIVGTGGTTVEQAPYVDFKRFKAIISSIPANETISIKAGVNDLEISYALKNKPVTLNGSVSGMLPLPSNNFSSFPVVTIPKDTLVSALSNATAIIAESDSSPIYNCIRIATNGVAIDFSAVDIDTKRTFVSTANATQNNPVAEILVEAPKMKKSLKIFEDYQELDMYMDNAVIRVDGAVMNQNTPKTKGMITNVSYYTRRLSGAFPSSIKNSYAVLPSEFCEINKEEMISSLSRVKALEDSGTGGLIGFEVNGSNCIISIKSSHGTLEDSIIMENVSSKSFKTVFKHQNISDIIKVIPTDTFEIGALPQHPANYVVRAKGCTDVMFTVLIMVGSNNP